MQHEPSMDWGQVELQNDADVVSAEGEKIGTVNRVVVNPRTKKIDSLVIRQGFINKVDKVIPMDMIETADKEKVTLKPVASSLDELPNFEENYFVTVDPNTGIQEPAPIDPILYPPRIYPYPPLGVSPAYYPGFFETYSVKTDENIPQDTIPLKEGARVVSADDKHVGSIERVFVDSETEKVTHFLVSEGVLFKEHKLIPSAWVNTINEEAVRLGVDADVLNRVKPYKED